MFPACTGACCCFWLDERYGFRAVWGFQATQYGGFFVAAYLQSFFLFLRCRTLISFAWVVACSCAGGLRPCPFLSPIVEFLVPQAHSTCFGAVEIFYACHTCRSSFTLLFCLLNFCGPTVHGATDGTVLRGLFLSADGSDFVFFSPSVCLCVAAFSFLLFLFFRHFIAGRMPTTVPLLCMLACDFYGCSEVNVVHDSHFGWRLFCSCNLFLFVDA
ncbi:hypothetical protein TcG_01445 [Trypanosoma cruzi]|nr:hypothetical protein TcG_01445 [Trypanosoma cruzi]